jgi:hypothetical protein
MMICLIARQVSMPLSLLSQPAEAALYVCLAHFAAWQGKFCVVAWDPVSIVGYGNSVIRFVGSADRRMASGLFSKNFELSERSVKTYDAMA